jgi:hypothetical protein
MGLYHASPSVRPACPGSGSAHVRLPVWQTGAGGGSVASVARGSDLNYICVIIKIMIYNILHIRIKYIKYDQS